MRLDQATRYQIHALIVSGNTADAIAKQLGVHRATVFRELARNGGRKHEAKAGVPRGKLAMRWDLKPSRPGCGATTAFTVPVALWPVFGHRTPACGPRGLAFFLWIPRRMARISPATTTCHTRVPEKPTPPKGPIPSAASRTEEPFFRLARSAILRTET